MFPELFCNLFPSSHENFQLFLISQNSEYSRISIIVKFQLFLLFLKKLFVVMKTDDMKSENSNESFVVAYQLLESQSNFRSRPVPKRTRADKAVLCPRPPPPPPLESICFYQIQIKERFIITFLSFISRNLTLTIFVPRVKITDHQRKRISFFTSWNYMDL